MQYSFIHYYLNPSFFWNKYELIQVNISANITILKTSQDLCTGKALSNPNFESNSLSLSLSLSLHQIGKCIQRKKSKSSHFPGMEDQTNLFLSAENFSL